MNDIIYNVNRKKYNWTNNTNTCRSAFLCLACRCNVTHTAMLSVVLLPPGSLEIRFWPEEDVDSFFLSQPQRDTQSVDDEPAATLQLQLLCQSRQRRARAAVYKRIHQGMIQQCMIQQCMIQQGMVQQCLI